MAITITITTAGSSISDPLGVYTSPDNIAWTLDANVAKATLLTGYTFTPPVGTYYYQVRDLGTCESILSLNCTTTTTTTAAPTTTTTTTTAGPTTTTTTTTTGGIVNVNIYAGSDSEPPSLYNIYYSIDAGAPSIVSKSSSACELIAPISMGILSTVDVWLQVVSDNIQFEGNANNNCTGGGSPLCSSVSPYTFTSGFAGTFDISVRPTIELGAFVIC